ncbi:ABC transporter substrate-binding protein [Pigmentibacter sp. JX0631]|uniref:ABC transporter substrate-binding protein n=1 Tax=Pigmentibacter sp. JX0631 TaxID=2976982 RepID=UPI0024690445|nr:ABC transporter substrate-binding protein [Pigmentibacter sp. JX0631]WGL59451.1 ABC transporter substrate-binding protein [Pigmentibacter sp. JX0631]
MKNKASKVIIKIFSFTILILLLSNNYARAEIPPDIKKIISRGKIIIAINGIDYPPFFYETKNSKLEGIDVDISKDIGKYLGVNVEFDRSAKTFKDVVKLVENEKADLAISALSGTLNRGISVRVSSPYFLPNQVVITNRLLELKINNDVKIPPENGKIAILNNAAYEDFANQNYEFFKNNFKDFSVVKYDSLENAFNDVIEGKILGLYVDEIYANNLLANDKRANLFVRKKIVTDAVDPICIILNWKTPNLANWINLYITRMKNNGKEKTLAKKYMKEMK